MSESPALFQLSRYEIGGVLGEGAVAVVYRARDRELNRPVAIKFLRDTLSLSEVARERFHREAQVAGGLSHANLVSVHDAGTESGRMYLVMELVQGRPLSQVLAERKYEVRPMLLLLEKVARGVAAAHEKGIVHRDLKPANILVTPEGEPKVADFGLAHLVGSETGLTRTGTALGTPLYMAPEQLASGEWPITPGTDVYALGAILYEILTGRPPHLGDSLMELYGKIAQEEPHPPRKIHAGVPRDAETITLKALEKDPGRRYESAREFADDLRRYLDGEPVLARPARLTVKAARWIRRHRTACAVATVILAAGLGVAGAVAINAARFRRQIDGLLAEAARAEREGRFAVARDLYADVKALRPGHAVAEARYYESDRAAAMAARRKAAEQHLAEGRRAKDDYDRMQREYERMSKEEAKLAAEIDPHEGPEKKQPLWAIRRKLREMLEAMTLRHQDVAVSFISALGADPDNREAREALAGHYFAEFGLAEREGDRVQAIMNEKMTRHFDLGTFAPRLVQEGTIQIDSVPPGAEVELLQYEEGLDSRLVAKPLRALGRCPVPRTKLGGGSYLLLLRLKGYRDVRYPVRVGRGSELAARVNLYTDSEIGTDFVYVPAGEFIQGGDPKAHMSLPLGVGRTDDFFIGRFEVTSLEYADFLNDRTQMTVEEAWRRSPRESANGGQYWERHGNRLEVRGLRADIPALGISWDDASAYCLWRTRRAAAGGDRSTYRLATGPEWEKAARGVDGRLFPWGNHFDWSFVKGGRSRKGKPLVEPGGVFAFDESPYGVRDLSGSLREWCQDWYDEQAQQRLARGGVWAGMEDVFFRSAMRGSYIPIAAGSQLGIRLVRTPPAR